MDQSQELAQPITYGQRQVALSFNPSQKKEVRAIKLNAAALIDELNDQRKAAQSAGLDGEILARYTIAIRHVEEASMRGVSAATFNL